MFDKCQYCHGPSPDGYTCKACQDGWPTDECRCVNNGDYCDACAEWIDHRQEVVFIMNLGRVHAE